MPKKTKVKKQKKDSYFSNVIHMRDDLGTYCASRSDGDVYNRDPELVNCKKCFHYLEHPGLLQAKRKRDKEKAEAEEN